MQNTSQLQKKVRRKTKKKFGENYRIDKTLYPNFHYGISRTLKGITRAIEKNIAKQKSSGILQRTGANKSGYWIVKIKKILNKKNAPNEMWIRFFVCR